MNAASSSRRPSALPLTVAWVVLLALSLLSFYLAEGRLAGKALVAVVFGAAFVKLTLVAASFMELWDSGRPYLYMAVGLFAVTLGLMFWAW